MSNEVISAEQIEGLEELIVDILNRKISQVSSNAEDIEQLKKSPAGTIIRLEEHVNAIDEKIDNIESKMVTKQDLERLATKEELYALVQEVKALTIRIEEQGKRLSFFQTVTYGFLGVLFAMMAAILVKMFLP